MAAVTESGTMPRVLAGSPSIALGRWSRGCAMGLPRARGLVTSGTMRRGGGGSRAGALGFAEPLEGRVLLSVSPIDDINATPVSAAPSLLTAINSGPAAGTLIFSLNKQLWKS